MGLVAPWHEGLSQTRNQTLVPVIGRQILNHWPTREALSYLSVTTANHSIKKVGVVHLDHEWIHE